MATLRGHCLCKAIQFELSGEPLQLVYCHCESCRRNTSSPVTAFVIANRDDVRFTAGQPKMFNSSPGVRRSFCDRCGSPIAYESERRAGQIDLYVCSLSNPDALAPTFHVHAEEQVTWFETADDLPRYATTPRDGEPMRYGPRARSG